MKKKITNGFFYGLYMDPELLKSINVNPGEPIISCIEGFQLDVRGKVKAIRKSGKNIWGVTYRLKQEDLDRMYSGDLTREYRAEKMIAITKSKKNIEVWCYNLPIDNNSKLNKDYLEKLIVVAKKIGLPVSYVNELEKINN